MTNSRFCNYENERFAGAKFLDLPDGLTVHLASDKNAHTLDGWPVRKKKSQNEWAVDNVVIDKVTIPAFDEFPL